MVFQNCNLVRWPNLRTSYTLIAPLCALRLQICCRISNTCALSAGCLLFRARLWCGLLFGRLAVPLALPIVLLRFLPCRWHCKNFLVACLFFAFLSVSSSFLLFPVCLCRCFCLVSFWLLLLCFASFLCALCVVCFFLLFLFLSLSRFFLSSYTLQMALSFAKW
jgi:hypothetical protein